MGAADFVIECRALQCFTSAGRAAVHSNRDPGAAGQNGSCSIKRAAKQEKFRPLEEYFFLTSLFIALTQVRCFPRVVLEEETVFVTADSKTQRGSPGFEVAHE